MVRRFFRRGEVTIRPMTLGDMEELRRVGQEAWSDLASRDIGRKVQYPVRSRQIIEAYIRKEPGGCLLAEKDGEIIGAGYSHAWGSVGWIGPFEVLPDHQNVGIGGRLLARCESYLTSKGCRVIGLETMSHVAKNLHFYLAHGYNPSSITLIMDRTFKEGEVFPHSPVEGGVREVEGDEVGRVREAMKRIGDSMFPGLDHTSELDMLMDAKLGSAFVWEDGDTTQGVALLHTFQRSEDGAYSSVKLLIVDPDCEAAETGFLSLLESCERRSVALGKKRLYARFEVKAPILYSLLSRRSYAIKGSNIRFVKSGRYHENGAHVLSSWAG